MTRAVAAELAAQTIYGAAMLVKETQESATKLKEQVTSPGGTTISGLHVLEKGGFKGLVMDAVEAATQRSKGAGKVIRGSRLGVRGLRVRVKKC